MDRLKPKTPQDDGRRLLGRGHDQYNLPGIVASIPHQFRKGLIILEGASHFNDRSASSRKSDEVIMDEPRAGKRACVVPARLAFGIQ